MDVASRGTIRATTTRAEVVRFAQVAHRALPSSGLSWVRSARIHQDLGTLIREARCESPRPVLLHVLMQLVVEELADSELSSRTLDQLSDSTARIG